MAGHADRQTLIEFLSDELAYRAGLLLSTRDVQALAPYAPRYGKYLAGDLDAVLRRVSDYYEELARELRVAIGNLKDGRSALERRIPIMTDLAARDVAQRAVLSERADATAVRTVRSNAAVCGTSTRCRA